jgi:hypothetical protein
LALAFAVAAIACLTPMAHADDAQLVAPSEPGIQPVRTYVYFDNYNGTGNNGTMVVKDGPRYSWGRRIYVTIYVNGYTFSGKGWRFLKANEQTLWFDDCDFWVYGNGLAFKFKGFMALKPGKDYGQGRGEYFLNGSGPPYYWMCSYE